MPQSQLSCFAQPGHSDTIDVMPSLIAADRTAIVVDCLDPRRDA